MRILCTRSLQWGTGETKQSSTLSSLSFSIWVHQRMEFSWKNLVKKVQCTGNLFLLVAFGKLKKKGGSVFSAKSVNISATDLKLFSNYKHLNDHIQSQAFKNSNNSNYLVFFLHLIYMCLYLGANWDRGLKYYRLIHWDSPRPFTALWILNHPPGK